MAFTYCESAWLCAAIALLPASIATPAVALIFISLIYDWVVYRMNDAADGMPAEGRRSDAGMDGLAPPVGDSDVLHAVSGPTSPLTTRVKAFQWRVKAFQWRLRRRRRGRSSLLRRRRQPSCRA